MTDPEKFSNEELEKMIAERKATLKQIIDFVNEVLPRQGKLTKHQVYSDRTDVVYELTNFGDFDFILSYGQRMLGGTIIRIWRHGGELLADMNYQTSDEVAVVSFNNGQQWQSDLRGVIINKDKIIEERAGEGERQKREILEKQAEEVRRKELLEMAERLKL